MMSSPAQLIAGCAAQVVPKEAGPEDRLLTALPAAGTATPSTKEDLGGASPCPSQCWMTCLPAE